MQNWKLDPAEELKKKKAGEYDKARKPRML
jgi:hypothetical protein